MTSRSGDGFEDDLDAYLKELGIDLSSDTPPPKATISVDEEIAQTERDAEPPRLYFGSVDEFVREFLVRVFRRAPEAKVAWCANWWKHAEAILRLESMWRTWEHLRLDPATGMSVWLTQHAEPQLRILMDPVAGPFAKCTDGGCDTLEPLPYKAPEPGLFPDVRDD